MGFIVALALPFLIIIGAILLAVFGVTLALFLNNLKDGLKNKWQTKFIVGTIITGVINFCALITIIIIISSIISYLGNDNSSNTSSSANIETIEEAALYIKYFLLAHF